MFAPLEWLVRTYIGKATDTGGSATTGTVTAKINNIITNLLGATNNTGGSANAGTMMAKLNTLINSANSINTNISASRGAVKSIQRGTFNTTTRNATRDTYGLYQDITISAININKSILIASGGGGSDTQYAKNVSDAASGEASGKFINSTTLRLYATYYNGQLSNGTCWHNINWQVVEFY